MKKSPETSTYKFATTSKYTNARSSDCVIRSISLALGKSWEEVFDSLVEIAREMYRVPNEKIVWEKYLAQQGWKKMPMPRQDGNRRVKASEFCKSFQGTACVAKVGTHHLSCIKNGKIHDIWDCGEYCMGNYWVKGEQTKAVPAKKTPKKKQSNVSGWDTTPRNSEVMTATGGWNYTGTI